MKRRLIKNAIANVARGGASALVALGLPPLLIRHMQPSAYAVWVLVLQVTAYIGFLDFGLQTAVGRYIAFAEEKKDTEWRNGIFSTAFAGLSIAALLGIVALVAAAIFARLIFPAIPVALLPSMRWAILIAGISTAIGLPASAWNGVFVGLQRYEIPAMTISAGRLLSSIGLVLAALSGKSIAFMACIVAGANIITYIGQFVALRRLLPDILFRVALITKTTVKELAGYCVSLMVWSFSMLLVTGFDLILVGRFQFSAVASYSTAAVLITFLGGLLNSLFSVIMPHSAKLDANGNEKALGALLLKSTRLATIFLVLTGLPLVILAFPIMNAWLGSQYAIGGSKILIVLVIGNMIRLLGVPYGSILVGTGQQRLIIAGPLLEGVSNLTASLVLGLRFGAMGVAWGTLIGAAVGFLTNLFYSIPKTRARIDISASSYLKKILYPVFVCGLPLIILFICARLVPSHVDILRMSGLALSMCISLFLVLQATVKRQEL